MEHKAFIFDYDKFQIELYGTLVLSLENWDYSHLKTFILQNIFHLRDPYEGEPLDNDWEKLIETYDPHQYGDFAITKYYNPSDDIGLGYNWQSIHEKSAGQLVQSESPILGTPIGPKDKLFDPGKMGSYFQSAFRVKQNLAFMRTLAEGEAAKNMLEKAASLNMGLYVTF